MSNMIGKGTLDYEQLSINRKSEGEYSAHLNAYACDKFSPNYKFGMGMMFDIHDLFSIGFDVNYETKGYKMPIKPLWISDIGSYDGQYIDTDLTATIRIHYFVLPFNAEIHYKMFYFSAGIYTGVLLDSRYKIAFMYENQEFNINNKIRRGYALIDIGAHFNTGVLIPISQKDFLKIGVGGAWNISRTSKWMLYIDIVPPPFYSQVFSVELKYERKIK